MKTPLCLSFVLALAVVGCDKQSGNTTSSTNTNSSASSTTVSSVVSAPVDYLGALAKGKQTATKTVDVAALNSAISLFQAEKGRTRATSTNSSRRNTFR
jgi:hypothetical protein